MEDKYRELDKVLDINEITTYLYKDGEDIDDISITREELLNSEVKSVRVYSDDIYIYLK